MSFIDEAFDTMNRFSDRVFQMAGGCIRNSINITNEEVRVNGKKIEGEKAEQIRKRMSKVSGKMNEVEKRWTRPLRK